MVGPERRPVPPALQPISDEDRRLHRKVILGKVEGLPLGRNPKLDVRCLSQGKRISESVMDLFFGRLSDWVARNPDWAILRSDMFAHLRHSSPPSKGACLKLATILRAKDYVMLPCYLDDHWILVIIRSNRLAGNANHRIIHVINSLGSHLNHLLLSILNGALGANLTLHNWPVTWTQVTVPCQQQNQGSVDCGVHVMHNSLSLASRFALGLYAGPSFSPDDFRVRAAVVIATPAPAPLWDLGAVTEYSSE
jgi:hypothetical protein